MTINQLTSVVLTQKFHTIFNLVNKYFLFSNAHLAH